MTEEIVFLDDTYLQYKPRVSYSLLTAKDYVETEAFIQTTPIRIKKHELRAYLLSPENYKYAFLAKVKGRIVGILLFTDFEDEVFINHLYVTPVHRFKGISSNLIRELKAFMPQRSLSFLDASNNYMPWMDALGSGEKITIMNHLGSFYKRILD